MADGFREGFVRVGGCRIYYKTRGKPTNGTILTIHGGPGANHIIMLRFADLAQFGYRVVWYDQSGCGRSTRPRAKDHYTLESWAHEAEGVRRALRLGPVHLVGHSFGALVALEMVLRHPSSVRSLTVGSGFSSAAQAFEESMRRFQLAPKRLRTVIRRAESKGHLSDPDYVRAKAEYLRLPYRTSEGRPAVLRRSEVAPWEVSQMIAGFNPRLEPIFYGRGAAEILGPIDGTMEGWDVTARLRDIRVPTLVTVGRYDTVDPRLSRILHRRIRDSKLVVFERSGHGTIYDERDGYMRTMRDFLASVSGRESL